MKLSAAETGRTEPEKPWPFTGDVWGCSALGVRHHPCTVDESSSCSFSRQERSLWTMPKLGEPQVDMASTGAGHPVGELRRSRWPGKDDWEASALVSSLAPQEGNLQVPHQRGIEMPGGFPLAFPFAYACKLCQWCRIFLSIHVFICFLAHPGFRSELFQVNSFNLLLLLGSHAKC